MNYAAAAKTNQILDFFLFLQNLFLNRSKDLNLNKDQEVPNTEVKHPIFQLGKKKTVFIPLRRQKQSSLERCFWR